MRALKVSPLALAIAVALASCGAKHRPAPIAPVPSDWHRTITSSDMSRLREWREAFVRALEKARAAGHGSSIAREGALLEPDAARMITSPTPGSYHCRTIKVGGRGSMMGDYVVYGATPCKIALENDVLSFSKSGGSQRPVGLLFPGEPSKLIFLGTMMLGDEQRPLEYGRDSRRDMVGAFEMIGPSRWRLVLPYPRFESMLDVVEVVPD